MTAVDLGFMHSEEEHLPLATVLDVRAKVPPPECFEGALLCSQVPSPALPPILTPTASGDDTSCRRRHSTFCKRNSSCRWGKSGSVLTMLLL